MTPLRRPWVSAEFGETVVAGLLLLWRLWILLPGELWRDPLAILASYWLFLRFAGHTKAWRPVTFLVMTGLLALYAWGQVPQTLSLLEMKP